MTNVVRFRRPDKLPKPRRPYPSLIKSWITFLLIIIALISAKWFGIGERGINSTGRVTDGPEGTVFVVDGDSINIGRERIRLYGIDAPEALQTCKDSAGAVYDCGQRSTEALKNLLRGKTIRCESRGNDEYGRVVAICVADGVDVNAQQVESGMAVAYRDITTLYVSNEETAKQNRRGLWAGSFELPWDYRREAQKRER